MSGIYDMNYDDFKHLCWGRWGIEISQSWPQDASGRVTDRRKNEYVMKYPIIDNEGIHFVGDRMEYRFTTLRDCIWKISHDRKLNKDYYATLEKHMTAIYKSSLAKIADAAIGGYVHE